MGRPCPTAARASTGCANAGDYALSTGDALPHLERGGDAGGLVFFGCHASDGILYEILDEDGNLLMNVTIESLVEDWKANT